MDLGQTDRLKSILTTVKAMITEEIAPLDAAFLAEVGKGDRWAFTERQTEILEGLKAKAKAQDLWNFWDTFRDGPKLNTVEYAYLAEEMGKSHLAAEVFNCNAPDTGNMEVFARYGTDAMKTHWLQGEELPLDQDLILIPEI